MRFLIFVLLLTLPVLAFADNECCCTCVEDDGFTPTNTYALGDAEGGACLSGGNKCSSGYARGCTKRQSDRQDECDSDKLEKSSVREMSVAELCEVHLGYLAEDPDHELIPPGSVEEHKRMAVYEFLQDICQ